MSAHCESKSLANHIVEGYCQEVASDQQQAYAIDSVKFTPLGFFLEHFVYFYCLTSFSHRQRQFFFLELQLILAFHLFWNN